MQETEIKDRLESLLGIEGLTIQVVLEENSLFVILNRSGAEHLDYTPIVDQVVDEVELSLIPVQSIQFYSRVLGEHEPDWARTIPIGQQGTGNATVIVSAARSAPTVIEESNQTEDQSTKLVVPPPSVTKVIANETTTIEEESFNLPKPDLKDRKPKKTKPIESPPEEHHSFSAPTIEAPIADLLAEQEELDNSGATEVAAPPPRPKPKVEPIPAPAPAPSPLPKVVIALVISGSLIIALGWFVWSKTRSKPKPKPKKAQIEFMIPAKINYLSLQYQAKSNHV